MDGIGKINEVFGNQGYKKKIQNTRETKGKKKVFLEKDKLEISAKGRSLAEINREASRVPLVREEVVRKLKAQIRSGSYKIDPDRIARNLVNKWFSGKG